MPDETELEDAETSYEEVKEEATAWLRANWDPDITVRQWWAKLAGSGWGQTRWPKAYFGRGISPQLNGAVREAYEEVGALGPPTSLGQGLGGPTLLTHASDEMKARFLPALATGEEFWCQFFSEPGSGSDLASAQTRAVRHGDEFIVNGQKVWTSGAQYADRGMLVSRTNIDVPKHRGITYFIIDVDQPGIEVRPLHQMNGAHGFNEVFFTDAHVPADRIVGEEDNGWAVAVTTLMFERFSGGFGVPAGRKFGLLDRRAGDVVLERLSGEAAQVDRVKLVIDAAQKTGKSSDPITRQAVANTFVQSEMQRLSQLRSAASVRAGRRPGPEGSVRKLSNTIISRAAARAGMAILGAEGTIVGEDTLLGGQVQYLALSTPSASIAGGTDEIQHNILGERVLGLPKEPAFDRDVPFRELRVGTQRI